jgi:hypothetical protein
MQVQSPHRIEELVSIFIQTTKVKGVSNAYHLGTNRRADGNWILGHVSGYLVRVRLQHEDWRYCGWVGYSGHDNVAKPNWHTAAWGP